VCGHAPRETKVAVIGYYGRLGRNIGPHRVVDESALAAEFDQATASFVVEANNYYRYCLIRHIAPHFERALHEMFATVASEPDTLEEEGAWISDPIVAAHHPWDTLGTD